MAKQEAVIRVQSAWAMQMKLQLKKQKAIRRDGYNRGVRAALRRIESWMQDRFKTHDPQGVRDMAETAECIHRDVKKQLKPRLDETIQIQGRDRYLKKQAPQKKSKTARR